MLRGDVVAARGLPWLEGDLGNETVRISVVGPRTRGGETVRVSRLRWSVLTDALPLLWIRGEATPRDRGWAQGLTFGTNSDRWSLPGAKVSQVSMPRSGLRRLSNWQR